MRLHYNYFRDYDPTIGRYVQSDPIGLDGGLSTYGYVGGNPLTRVDPEGQQFALPMPQPGIGLGAGSGSGAIARGLQRLWNEFCEGVDRQKQCDYQYYEVDIPVCRAIKRNRGAAAARRCYASAADRYAACLQGNPLPPLDTRNN